MHATHQDGNREDGCQLAALPDLHTDHTTVSIWPPAQALGGHYPGPCPRTAGIAGLEAPDCPNETSRGHSGTNHGAVPQALSCR
jgi:hypothetical protein